LPIDKFSRVDKLKAFFKKLPNPVLKLPRTIGEFFALRSSLSGGERGVGIPRRGAGGARAGGGAGGGAFKRSLGSGLLPRPSNPDPVHFVILFKTKQFF